MGKGPTDFAGRDPRSDQAANHRLPQTCRRDGMQCGKEVGVRDRREQQSAGARVPETQLTCRNGRWIAPGGKIAGVFEMKRERTDNPTGVVPHRGGSCGPTRCGIGYADLFSSRRIKEPRDGDLPIGPQVRSEDIEAPLPCAGCIPCQSCPLVGNRFCLRRNLPASRPWLGQTKDRCDRPEVGER